WKGRQSACERSQRNVGRTDRDVRPTGSCASPWPSCVGKPAAASARENALCRRSAAPTRSRHPTSLGLYRLIAPGALLRSPVMDTKKPDERRSWWARRTKMERCLLVSLGLVTIIAVILIITTSVAMARPR
ncbi:hypothetical protein HPB47_002888, partial [Ixodes persulcatus]